MGILDETDPVPDRTVRYAEHDDGLLDLHLPTNRSRSPDSTVHKWRLDAPELATRRLLVLLHGGFWKTAYDRQHTRPMAAAFAQRGFTVATPEYRRVGPDGSGGWPATLDDVRRAMELAIRETEPDRVVVTGHSAGGHLALCLAAEDPPVDRVVGLAPVCDVREAIRLGLGSDAARAFLGGLEPDGVDAADPMALLDRRPSAQVCVVHGAEDDVVPVSLSRGLVARHPWVDLLEIEGAGHFEVIDPATAAFAAYAEVVSRSFSRS